MTTLLLAVLSVVIALLVARCVAADQKGLNKGSRELNVAAGSRPLTLTLRRPDVAGTFYRIEEHLRKRSGMHKGERQMYTIQARAGPCRCSCSGEFVPFPAVFRALETGLGEGLSQLRNRPRGLRLQQTSSSRHGEREFLAVMHT